MSDEKKIRQVLRRIDALREKARVAETMHTRWTDGPGALEVHTVRVVRRWYAPGRHTQATETYELTTLEREALREWFYARVRELNAEADALANDLTWLPTDEAKKSRDRPESAEEDR